MRLFLTTIVVLIFASTKLVAEELNDVKINDDWFRYAAISPDGSTIAFTFKGDIYIVDSKGGVAKQLTIHTAHDYHPVWSHDGRNIAFASNRYGNFDVFVVSAEGGEARRLTYHSNDEIPYEFSINNEHVIFKGQRMDVAEHRQFPNSYLTEVYTVPSVGGRVEQLWTLTAEDICVSKDGKTYLYHDKKGGENEFRKHHVSSVARDIWMFNIETNEHTKVTSFEGEDRSPKFAMDQNEFYFLSESSGTFNVHRKGLKEEGNGMQITEFKEHPVRFLSCSKNGTLCFTNHGSIYTMTDETKLNSINIVVKQMGAENEYTFFPVSGNISEISVAPDGKEIAFIVRGDIFTASAEGSMFKQITSTVAEERDLSFSVDGKKIIYTSERLGRWGIYSSRKADEKELHFYASTNVVEEEILVNEHHNEQAVLSPDGNMIAFTENKTTLKILDLKSGNSRVAADSDEITYMNDGGQDYVWSPDSKWLAATFLPTLANAEIYLIDARGEKPNLNLTQNGHLDFAPEWVDSGNVLIWKSTRLGMRDYANSGNRQSDVYGLFMNKEAWEKYRLSEDEFKLWKEKNESNKEKEEQATDKGKKAVKEIKDEKSISPVVIDFDGLLDRVERLTIHSSDINDATLSSDGGSLYYLAKFEQGTNLWSTDLRTKETKMIAPLNAGFASFEWDASRKNLFILVDGNPMKFNEAEKKTEPVQIKGKLKVNEVAERKEMFEHVWQRTQAMFYDRSFHGIDWDFYGYAYRVKLSSIGNDVEFAELLSEMLGELNVSHCGAGARMKIPNADQTSSLGIFRDYTFKEDGILISEVLKNGPLDKIGMNINPGMIIKSINGTKINKWIDDAILLNNLNSEYIALEVYDPKSKSSRSISVRPISLGEEMELLYKRWVKTNADEVEKASDGKLGYVHVPGMGDGPYRSLYGDIMGKYFNCEGIVVDTRFNRGGDLVADLNMFLSGEEFITYENDQRKMGYEPNFRWTKESVVLANEANYSDGSCFACGYKQQNIGKLMGMPVPGTCSFASWEGLINGSVYWGSVTLSAKDIHGEWMENNQTEPDILIKNNPNKIVSGIDEQLQGAVKELMNVN